MGPAAQRGITQSINNITIAQNIIDRQSRAELWQFEQMLVEAQQLHDQVLEARCRMAVHTNRLVRLDNPIAAAQLAAIQVRDTRSLRRSSKSWPAA